MTHTFTPLTPHHNLRRPSMIIIHGTEVDDARSRAVFAGQTEHEASCHYYIDDKGEVTQYLDEQARAWHAGQGYWAGFNDVNSLSIGIELLALSNTRKFDGPETLYTAAQMAALVPLLQGIITRHKIAPWHVLGHQDVSFNREFEPTPENMKNVVPAQPVSQQKKYDPGPNFDWAFLAENGIGAWHGLKPAASDPVIAEDVEFILKLAAYGYDVHKDIPGAIRAFQAHFLPWNICGQVTEQSVAALDILLQKKLQ